MDASGNNEAQSAYADSLHRQSSNAIDSAWGNGSQVEEVALVIADVHQSTTIKE